MYESKGCNLRTYGMSAGMGALNVEINVDTTTEVFLPCDEELVLEDWKPVPVARKEEARPLKGVTKELVAIELDVALGLPSSNGLWVAWTASCTTWVMKATILGDRAEFDPEGSEFSADIEPCRDDETTTGSPGRDDARDKVCRLRLSWIQTNKHLWSWLTWKGFCGPGKLSFPKMGHLHYLYVAMENMTPVNQIKQLYFLSKKAPAQVYQTLFRDNTLKMFSQKWFFD